MLGSKGQSSRSGWDKYDGKNTLKAEAYIQHSTLRVDFIVSMGVSVTVSVV